MHALFSTSHPALARAHPGFELSTSVRQALRWGSFVAIGLAAATLLSYGIAVFEASVATELATGSMQHGLTQADKADLQDPFLQQKLDAKIEELPAQF